MRKLLPLLALPFLAVPAAAQEQSPCGPYEAVSAALADKYHETPVARMLSDRGFVIEILASADGASFTVLGIQSSGSACVLAAGSTFALVSALEAPKPGTNS